MGLLNTIVAGYDLRKNLMPKECRCLGSLFKAQEADINSFYSGAPDFISERGLGLGDERRAMCAELATRALDDLIEFASRAVETGCPGSVLGFCRQKTD